MDLDAPVSNLPGVGPARARALAAAGCTTLYDLLAHLPVRYEDRRALATVAQALALLPTPAEPSGEGEWAREWTLRGRLAGLRLLRLPRGKTMVRGSLVDATGALPVLWWNRPYLARQADPAADYLLHGRLRATRTGAELLNPSVERVDAADAAGGPQGLTAVYRGVRGAGPAVMARLLAPLLDRLAADAAAATAEDPLPASLRERRLLPPLGEALLFLHRPPSDSDLANLDALKHRATAAHRRLLYGERLETQLALGLLRQRRASFHRSRRLKVTRPLARLLREIPPFPLTAAQRRVVAEIAADLGGPHPMERLLQGDVGSGKTIVAALALALAAENGLQGALMAPTELLAEQHFAGLERLLGERYRTALFTSSSPDLDRRRRELAAGAVDLAVGTHALLQDSVCFARLGLAVVDEQHRFGVAERRRLLAKGDSPDLLVMTATPIPRSLALTAYGDLDLSVLDELPPGRRPVATEVVSARERRAVYDRLAEALAAGVRAYVVFPRIEEGGSAEALAARGERIRQRLAAFPSAVLHGRLPATERDRAMRAFAIGEIRLLIATTVVEVGIDVPEATWMVIESAERFGLAQLHQLRGRVGRGLGEARCVAIVGRATEEARRRLAVFAATTDGFLLAEADLALRGPGDLLGSRQAGVPSLALADPAADLDLLLQARDDARELLPRLAEPGLAALRRRAEAALRRREAALAGG
ncbi:MAG TPA: ATP-dependent DNA helicase RecG [Thermoanaerobaculia bacterium]